METRNETDSLGTVAVPADRYWGAQTAHALADYGDGRAPLSRRPSSTPWA